MKSRNMNNVIFLGAGASHSEGAPLQNEVFREYFRLIRSGKIGNAAQLDVARFFGLIFSIIPEIADLDSTLFPTFEEALGILDLAEKRGEALSEFTSETALVNTPRIRYVRQWLIFVLAQVLSETLSNPPGYHQRLVDNLYSHGKITKTIFVSTNYDILIDNALGSLIQKEISLDYGLEFTNFDIPGNWHRPTNRSVKLFKPHGSLNWLFCPSCNTLTLTPYEKGVIRIITDPEQSKCKHCDSFSLPIIVPPTYFKDMSNIFLSTVWHLIEQELRDVNHLIFCGYSFPDADIHLKYLLKRIQTHHPRNIKITVFNNHTGKESVVKKDEQNRFRRFFGIPIDYREESFEDFSINPDKYLS